MKTRRDSSKVSLDAVAARAGVSKGMASAILGGGCSNIRFSEETRQKVLAEAAALNYHPPAAHTIGVMCLLEYPDQSASSDWLGNVTPMLSAIQLEAARHQKLISLYEFYPEDTVSRMAFPKLPQILKRRNTDGLIITGKYNRSLLECAEENRIPYVLMNVRGDEDRPEYAINFDEVASGRLATEFLLQRNHRRILHLTVDFPSHHYSVFDRRKGYEQTMIAANLPARTLAVRHSYEILQEVKPLLAGPNRPTAIFAYNESISTACYRVIHEAGLTMKDVELMTVAWQHQIIAEQLNIPHVLLPTAELGRLACRAIVKHIDHVPPAPVPPLAGEVQWIDRMQAP